MTAAFQEWVPLSGYRQEAFMTLVLMIGAAVCLLYYAGIVIFSGITTSFAWIWLVLAFALGGGALFRRYCCMMPGAFVGSCFSYYIVLCFCNYIYCGGGFDFFRSGCCA